MSNFKELVDKRAAELRNVLDANNEGGVTEKLKRTVAAYDKETARLHSIFGKSEIPVDERTCLKQLIVEAAAFCGFAYDIMEMPVKQQKITQAAEPRKQVTVKPRNLAEDINAATKAAAAPKTELPEAEKKLAAAQEANAKAVEKNSTDAPKKKVSASSMFTTADKVIDGDKPLPKKKDAAKEKPAAAAKEPLPVCPKCGKEIKPDDAVAWDKDNKPMHQTCPGEGNRKPKRKCEDCCYHQHEDCDGDGVTPCDFFEASKMKKKANEAEKSRKNVKEAAAKGKCAVCSMTLPEGNTSGLCSVCEEEKAKAQAAKKA
jgi:hypothetical protein